MMKETVKNYLKSGKKLCVVFLIMLYWELLLYYQLYSTLKGFSFWNVLFLIPISLLFTALTGWFSKHYKLDAVFQFLLSAVVSVFYISEYLYFKTFGSLFSVSMLGQGTDAIINFWWSLKSTIAENLMVIILFLLPAVLVLIFSLSGKIKTSHETPLRHLITAALAFVFWFVIVYTLPLAGTEDYTAYGAYHSRYIDTDTASRKLGALPNFIVELKCSVFGSDKSSMLVQVEEETETEKIEEKKVILYNEYEKLDFAELAKDNTDENINALCRYMKNTAPTVQNEYTGMFDGYNLIYICAESFSRMAIDEKITPTLYKLANNGIVLSNYYNSFRNVTTNGEYAFLTGLWPDVAREETNKGRITGTMGQSIEKNMSMALGNMFDQAEGLSSRAYHNYLGYYYGRNETLPNMGFTCKFMNEGMQFTTSWPASDLEMMEQSVDDYINDEQFVTYYMTFSGHGNYSTNNVMVYKNYNTVYNMLDENLSWNAIGYLSANYELEQAMTYLLDRLEEAGRLDDTVIVLTGDHYPYYLTDTAFTELTGEEMDPDFDMYKSTCIIYNAGLPQKISVDTPCCNVDILPTIYNLFNIKYDSRLYAGTDIFGNGMHLAQLYNKSFVTQYVKYNFATGEAEWLVDKDRVPGTAEKYLEKAINTAKNRYAMSIEIEESDFYQYVLDHFSIDRIIQKIDIDTEHDINEAFE